MGYSLTIGELKISIQGKGLQSYLDYDAEEVSLDNGPAYGEPTDNTNSRWPSYTSWGDSMDFLGLRKFSNAVLAEHPGVVPLTQEHKKEIDEAYERFYAKYPNAKAGYSPNSDGFREDENWPEENGYAVRLEWLKFWVDWALENCKVPVFANS